MAFARDTGVDGITDTHRQIQQGGTQGHPLQALDLNVLHHKRGRGSLSQEAGPSRQLNTNAF